LFDGRNPVSRFRPHLLLLVIVVAVVLVVVFSHGIRVRLIWGSSGFVVGLVCGVLLTMEIHHRRRRAGKK
jgi:cell division protein FtsW (lipid II flippase)